MTTGRHETRVLEQRVVHHLGLDRYAEAETLARSLVTSEPDSPTAHRLLARSLLGLGRPEAAMPHARESCRLAPEDVGSLVVLAECASSARDHSLAIDAAERAVATDPGSWATHYTLGKALLRAPGHSVSGALAAIDAAERIAPWSADVHNLRGMYLSDHGDRRGARAAYQRAMELDPHHALAMNNLAALDVRRRPLQSAKLLGSAAGLDPQRRLIQQNVTVVAWNILVYSQRVLYYGSFAVVLARGLGAPWWARVVMLGCMALAVVLWAGSRLRHLPRGYRQSPATVWDSFSRRQRQAGVGMGAAVVLMAVVAFAPQPLAGLAWIAMIASRLVARSIATGDRSATPTGN